MPIQKLREFLDGRDVNMSLFPTRSRIRLGHHGIVVQHEVWMVSENRYSHRPRTHRPRMSGQFNDIFAML
jgi:hypothetical protein